MAGSATPRGGSLVAPPGRGNTDFGIGPMTPSGMPMQRQNSITVMPQGSFTGMPPQGSYNGVPPQGSYNGVPPQGSFTGMPPQGSYTGPGVASSRGGSLTAPPARLSGLGGSLTAPPANPATRPMGSPGCAPVVAAQPVPNVTSSRSFANDGQLGSLQAELAENRRLLKEQERQLLDFQRMAADAEQARAMQARELEMMRAENGRLLAALAAEKEARELAEAALDSTDGRPAGSPPSTRRVSPQRSGSPGMANSFRRSVQSQRNSLRDAEACPRLQAQAKDDIDLRLLEFLERTDCTLQFKRMNRGWYKFLHPDDPPSAANNQHVELSIMNGKLMAKVDPGSHHERSWNNGKRGPIERFVMAYSQEP